MNRRSLWFWLALAVVIIAVGFVTSGRRNETGQPLDPDSTASLGTQALVELLERFDAEVSRDLPDPDTDVVLMLVDQLDAEQRADLESWVEQGGTVVVADPGSPLTPQPAFPIVERSDSLASGSCTVPGLDGLVLEAGSFLLYDRSDASTSCFSDDDGGAYVHTVLRGSGRVVSVGGGAALTNQYLDSADNAVLAVELLVPTRGSSSVAILFEPIVTPGSRSLTDLIPSSARWGMAQLLVGLVVAIIWKARRFGRPVNEAQPVKLPGSLLVRASGELRRRTGGFEAADQVVRHHHEQTLRRRLKVPADLPSAELLTAIESASGAERVTVERSLVAPGATSASELVDLVRAVDAVRLGLDETESRSLGPALPPRPGIDLVPDLEPQPVGERT